MKKDIPNGTSKSYSQNLTQYVKQKFNKNQKKLRHWPPQHTLFEILQIKIIVWYIHKAEKEKVS